MEFYLKEAFQSLKLLEDDFNLTADQGVIDELQSFVADDIEAPAEEEIIDVEADEVEDLQDNYIGKVILECDSCHTRIYKDIADVIIDEDSGLANVEEECPVCGNAFGWNVLGKIEKFDADEFKEEEHEDDEEHDDADTEEVEEISDDEISEALKEALSPEEQKELNGIVYNHLSDAAYEAEVDHELDAQRSDMEKAQKAFNDDFYFGTVEEDIDVHVDQPEESDDVVINVDADDELKEEFENPDDVGVDPDTAVEDDHDLETPMENPVTEIPDKLVVNESRLTEDVEHVKELVSGWLYDHLLDLNDNLAQQLHYEIPEYDVDWCSEDGMDDISYQVDRNMDEYVDSLTNLLFANAPRQESLGEDLEEVQSEDAEKLVDPEQEPVKDLNEDLDEAVSRTGAIAGAAVGAVVGAFTGGPIGAITGAVKGAITTGVIYPTIADQIKKEIDAGKWEQINDQVCPNCGKENTMLHKKGTPAMLCVNCGQGYQVNDGKLIKDATVNSEEPKGGIFSKIFVKESLEEDLNEVEVHTDEQDIEVKTEDGKVVVEVGNPEEAEPTTEDEMIAPLDAEEITDIENNEEQSAEEVAAEDELGTVEDEAPAEDDLDIDEFDEESFDEIGESYLHRVYENVNSFKTTSVTTNHGKLVIEGLIKFNSGKEKKTSFVFENFKTTKRGKLLSEGKNETFSKSNKAFLLKGAVADKKFVAESMTYNYTAKTINESNKSDIVRVYGRATRK